MGEKGLLVGVKRLTGWSILSGPADGFDGGGGRVGNGEDGDNGCQGKGDK